MATMRARALSLVAALAIGFSLLTPAEVAHAASVKAATPSISGAAQVGSTLTAKVGRWKPSGLRFKYQWYRSGRRIAGANAPTYTVAAADRGKTIKVKVTGSKRGYPAKSRTSRATKRVLAGTLTGSRPTVSGRLEVGASLAASPGQWTRGTKLSLQWLRNGSAIRGATGGVYRLIPADAAAVVTLRVTGALAGYTTTSRVWDPHLRVMLAGVPAISGAATVGSRLTASPGAWTSGVSLSYEWIRSSARIPGATTRYYSVAAADAGHKLSVRVTATASGYPTVQRTSASTRTVPAPTPPPTTPPPLAAAGYGTTGTRTQRMSDANLGSAQAGWYEANVRLGLACHKRGQSVKGFYSWSIPGGWSDLWYKVTDGYFVADVDLNTGTSNPVAPPCDGGSGDSFDARVDAFVARYANTYVNVDGAFGAQCTDLFNRYHMDLKGGSYVRMGGNGGAKNLWTTTNAQMLNWYTKVGPGGAARKGDVAVFNNGTYGHVAIVLSDLGADLRVFHQNDCGTNDQGVNKCPAREGTLSKSRYSLLGYFRPNR